MKSRRTYKSKYLILALILIAMFILPSCRTRLTNNSDVSNIQYDEDGYMTETYQMRRDELGLSTAESPILPDLGSSDEDEEVDDFSEGESIDYNPEDYEEDFTEPEPQTNTTTTTPTTRTPTTTTPRRTTPSTPSPTVTRYTITFDANGGKFNGGGEKYIANVPKGSKLGTHFPPTPTREGYALEGWYTSKDGGSKVKSKDTVNASKTLYAHWEKGKSDTPSKKKITITLNLNEGTGDNTLEVTEGSKYGTIPEPTREGYIFKGWYSDKAFKKKITEKTKVNPKITNLYAKWDPDPDAPYKAWEKKYNEEMVAGAEKISYVVADGTDKDAIDELMSAYKAKSANSKAPDYVVVTVKNPEKAQEEANKAIKAHGNEAVTAAIVINAESLKTKDDKVKLLNKIVLFEALYGGSEIGTAETELETEHTIDVIGLLYYDAANEEGENGEGDIVVDDSINTEVDNSQQVSE